MATYAGTYAPRIGSMMDGTPPVVWNCPIAASQTVKAGDFVVRTNGLVVTCAADGTMTLGIAMEDAPDDEGKILIGVATAQTLFMLPVHHGTPGNAVIEAADTDVTKTYDLSYETLPYWFVDKEGSAGIGVKIHKFVDPLATLNGLVLASIDYDHREVK